MRAESGRYRSVGFTAWIAILACAAPHHARGDDRNETKWHGVGRADLATGLAVRDDRGAVGQTEGTAVAFAYDFALGWRGAHGLHELSLSLTSAQGLSFVPVAGAFVKMIDDFRMGVGYEIATSRWVRPFVEVSADAPLFSTEEARPTETVFSILHPNGTTTRVLGTSLDLADPLRPFSVRESLGFRFRPLQRKELAITADLGLGAAHIFANGVRALEDDPKTTATDVVETQTSHAVGPEVGAGLAGRLDGVRLVYGLDARVRVPFASSSVRVANGLGAFERLNLEMRAKANLGFLPWLSLDYGFALRRRPLLTDRLELMNTLLLSVRPTEGGWIF